MATLAYGVKLYDCATQNGSYVEFANIKQLSTFPKAKGPAVDTTPLAPATAYRTFLIGLLDAGQCDFQQFFDEDEYVRWEALARTQRYYRIVFPGGQKIEFSGLVMEFGMEQRSNADDVELHGGSIKLTGGATFSVAP